MVRGGGANTEGGESSWIEAWWEEGGAKLGQERVWGLLTEIWPLGHQSVPKGS